MVLHRKVSANVRRLPFWYWRYKIGGMKNPTLLRSARFGALALLLGLAACSGVSANGDSPAAPVPPAAAPPAPASPSTSPAPAPAPAPVPAGQAHLALWKKIQDEIGTAECDNASQCRTMPVGHKACGGPEGYVAYSTKSGNTARLLALGEQYAAARKAENERSGILSNCMVERDPGATCVANRCVLVKGGTGVSAE